METKKQKRIQEMKRSQRKNMNRQTKTIEMMSANEEWIQECILGISIRKKENIFKLKGKKKNGRPNVES